MVFLLIVQPFAIASEHISDLSNFDVAPATHLSSQRHLRADLNVGPNSAQLSQDRHHHYNPVENTSTDYRTDPEHCGDDDSCTSGDCCHLAMMAMHIYISKPKHVFHETILPVSDAVILDVPNQPPIHSPS